MKKRRIIEFSTRLCNYKKKSKDKKIILVSKDVNLRLKAKALGLQSEDYTTGKVQNISSLYTGKTIR